jgi:hypothetical protein
MRIGMKQRGFVSGLAVALGLWLAPAAHADIIGGVDFPQGAVSFADTVVSYTVGPGGVTVPNQGALNALGLPDYTGAGCVSQAACTYVSLGDGGSIVLRFTDNLLTGSNSSALDLWIFEVGPDVEDQFVEISTDGVTWFPVGAVGGATAGVDIDAFGFTQADQFGYVRLTDDPDKDEQVGFSVGADIDAVGAISTVRRPIPEPATLGLLGGALAALALRRRRNPAR